MVWQERLRNNIRSIDKLLEYLPLEKDEEEALREVVKIHPINISKYYFSLIDKNNPNDPIRKMIIPSSKELITDGVYDTSGEKENTKFKGLQHKYSQTVLFLMANECTSYCRHCFRKRLVGLSHEEVLDSVDFAVDYIQNHKEVNNVLLTGGDSLIRKTKTLKKTLESLVEIPHLDFIRFGSRVFVNFPYRITEDPELIETIKEFSNKDKRIYFVTHFNHPNEITSLSREACSQIIESGAIMNNQTVLMKEINDNPEILVTLNNQLAGTGVTPYYFFQCRPVSRVKNHFQIPISKGIEIVRKANEKLNGCAKRFRYAMSHNIGKIEIIGKYGGEIIFKIHQARNKKNVGKTFGLKIDEKAGWLDNFEDFEKVKESLEK